MFMIIDDFLSPKECDAIVLAAEPKLDDSKVYGDSDTVDSKFRVSSQAWLKSEVAWLTERIATHSGKDESMQEMLQVVRYKKDGFFSPHFDACAGELGKRMNGTRGPRLLTYLMYLNDDFEGGETHFPNIDMTVTPKKGSLLLFANVDGQGNILKDMLHGGNPVLSGTKWICSVWVHSGV